MKKAVFLCIFLIGVGQIRSEVKYDHFVMKEAHIQGDRVNEDDNAGYPPFYAKCKEPHSKNGCKPAIPHANKKEGYVTITGKISYSIFYACLFDEINLNMVHFPQYFSQALILKKARRIRFFENRPNVEQPSWFNPYVNIYRYTCRSEISPSIWRMSPGDDGSYYIGFRMINHDDIPLAKVQFDHAKRIPQRVKHIVYAASLTAPIAASESLDEMVYKEDDSDADSIQHLINAVQSYYDFNNEKSAARENLRTTLTKYKLEQIPTTAKISIAHLIPEYDMPVNSWKKVSRFAHTVVPMWTELYHGVWADVEEMIREFSFWNGRDLSIYSGTHAQLTFNKGRVPEDKNKFFLNEDNVPVPELIWKLVVDEQPNTRGNKEAIAIVLVNLVRELEDLKIFNRIQNAPCVSTCNSNGWRRIDISNIFCCPVAEASKIIDEFPDIAKNYNNYFDVLVFKGEESYQT